MAGRTTKKTGGTPKTRKTGTASGKTGAGTSNTGRASARSKTSSGGTKTAGKRSSSGSGTQKRRTKTEEMRIEERTNPLLYFEIFLWLMLACSVFLFCSFLGAGGFVGEAVSSICFGCFGVLAYPLPFLLFFLTAFLISNRSSHMARIKAAGVCGLYLTACGIMELLMLGYTSGHTLMEYYEAGVQYKAGGGLTGGLFVTLFCPSIGMVGAYTVLIVIAIICVVLITQRSLFSDIHRTGSRAYQNAKEEKAKRKELMWQRRDYEMRNPEIFNLSDEYNEKKQSRKRSADPLIFPSEQREPRLNNRVTGVTSDTNLSGLTKLPSDEVRQVMPSPTEQTLEAPIANYRTDRSLRESGLVEVYPAQIDLVDKETLKKEKCQEKTKSAGTEREKAEEPDYRDLSGLEVHSMYTLEKASGEEEDPDQKISEEPGEPSGTSEETPEKPRRSPKPHASAEEIQEGIDHVEQEIEKTTAAVKPEYVFPALDLLQRPPVKKAGNTETQMRETAQKLQEVLHTFGVNVKVTNASCGPSVTRYELMPEMGVKVSKIVNLADDIKLNLAAADLRIEAPIPGKAAVGIEVPNKESSSVYLRELLESEEFRKHPSRLAYAVGKDIGGKIVVADIAKMPHLLIAGATGSGKSVFINTLIMSIIYKAKPEEVKMIMIDPKVVELSVYNGIPHLFIPVVTDPKKAAGALNWGVAEMMKRYELFAGTGVQRSERIQCEGGDRAEGSAGGRAGAAGKIAADRDYCGRAGRSDDGGFRGSRGCDLPTGPAGPCGRDTSGDCHAETVCGCHHGTDQGQYAVHVLRSPSLPVWIPEQFWIRTAQKNCWATEICCLRLRPIRNRPRIAGRICLRQGSFRRGGVPEREKYG